MRIEIEVSIFAISKLECGLEGRERNRDDAVYFGGAAGVRLGSRGTWPRSMGARVAPYRKRYTPRTGSGGHLTSKLRALRRCRTQH
jgi:hypothetical protein